MAFIYCAEAPVCAQSVPTFVSAGKQTGLPVNYTTAISATAPNYTAQCLAAKQKGVTALAIGEAAPILIRVSGDCNQQGDGPVYVSEGAGFALSETKSPGLKSGGLSPGETPSSAEIITGLDSLKGDDLQGMAPPLTCTAGKATSVDCWFTGRIQDGSPELENNGQVSCDNSASSSGS